jgi:hypothetical protein
MSTFDTPTDQSEFYIPEAGNFIGELVSVEPFDGKFGKSVRWEWVMFDMDGDPVLFNDEPAKFDALSTAKLGPTTKARKWANKHLAPDREVVEDEDPDSLLRELLGKQVKLSFAEEEADDGTVSVKLVSVMAYTG